ncbi:MAG TPA: hypothetical protein VGK13_00320 [Methanocellaceae archaeon]
MRSKVWVAGAIIAALIVCLVAVVAITVALQGPAETSSGACSVNGYVFDTIGEGIPGLEVTLHVMGDGGSTEIYNMTAPTQSSDPFVGLFVFDNVIIPSDAQYAYLSTSVTENNITYSGCTSNFTMSNNTSIHQSIVLHMPPLGATTVNGTVVSSFGKGMPNVTVTLHMTDAAGYPFDDLFNMSTTTDSRDYAGNYIFYAIPVNGTISGYTSAEIHVSDNMTIYGRSNNFTFKNGSVVSSFLVLHVPPEYLNETLNST